MSDLPSRLPLWGHLLCLMLAALTLAAAVWQHRRAGEKESLQQQADLRMKQPPLGMAELAAQPLDVLRWRRAEVAGTFDGEGQFLIDNKSHERQPGFHVIAPLELESGMWVLVNRGWLAAPALRADAAAPPVPQGTVSVSGLLVADASNAFELDGPQVEGVIWQNLNLERWRSSTGRAASEAVLLADADDAELVPVSERPDFRAETSRGYRLQWIMLFAVVIAGWWRVSSRLRKGEA